MLIGHLLDSSVPAATAQQYFSQLLLRLNARAVEVRLDAGPNKGKGIFAKQAFLEGDVLFVETPLVAEQHVDSRRGARTCGGCFRFIGSIEAQIAKRLLAIVVELKELEEAQAATTNGDDSSGSDDGQEGPSGSGGIAVTAGEALYLSQRLEQVHGALQCEQLQAMLTGQARLPLADRFPLPDPVHCRLGCGEQYCSSACENADWSAHHCLLCRGSKDAHTHEHAASSSCDHASAQQCTQHDHQQDNQGRDSASATQQHSHSNQHAGIGSTHILSSKNDSGGGGSCSISSAAAGADTLARALEAQAAVASAAGTSVLSSALQFAATAEAGSDSRSRHGCGSSHTAPSAHVSAEPTVDGVCEVQGVTVRRQALHAFYEHAAETNDVFILAAKVIAHTILRAVTELEGHETAASAPHGHSKEQLASALSAAWLPFALGWKAVWWEAVAVPDDVEDEDDFREQLRELAVASLELLRAAVQDERFPQLFTLEVYGSIIGMFELNNLSLTVPSPLEDYFLAVDDLPEEKKAQVQVLTQPLLDALDKDYYTPAEGSAFFALQSCANHSCEPNTQIFGDESGTATASALRPIQVGEEITISYIDEEMSYQARRLALRDYGFECSCRKCLAQQMSKDKGKRMAKGVHVGFKR